MKIVFDLEFNPEAIYTLYASLRSFKELKEKDNTADQFSMCAAEASYLMEQLKEQYPQEVEQCEIEFVSAHLPNKN